MSTKRRAFWRAFLPRSGNTASSCLAVLNLSLTRIEKAEPDWPIRAMGCLNSPSTPSELVITEAHGPPTGELRQLDRNRTGEFPLRSRTLIGQIVVGSDQTCRWLPASWLLPKYTRMVSWVNSTGIGPLSWLSLRFKKSRRVSRAKAGGICPASWLPSSVRDFKLSNSPNAAGIRPVSWLSPSDRTFSLLSCANSAGIEPVRLLSLRNSPSKAVSRANSAGMGPVSWFFVEEQDLQVSELSQLGGNQASQIIFVEFQPF